MKKDYRILFNLTLLCTPLACIVYAPFFAIIYFNLNSPSDFLIFTIGLIVYTLIVIPIIGTIALQFIDKLEVPTDEKSSK